MATQTYSQIQRQIEALQRQAEKIKASEVSGVVARIKVAIEHYGLTAEQLGLDDGRSRSRRSTAAAKPTLGARDTKGPAATAYADGNGNRWGGRGPRPRWLRDALAAGRSIEEFATGATASKPSAPTAKKSAGKRKAKTSYRDEAGNAWSGFGPKPRWLKDALAAGKALDDFAA